MDEAPILHRFTREEMEQMLEDFPLKWHFCPIQISAEVAKAIDFRASLRHRIMRWPTSLEQMPIEGELAEEEE